jgi:FkbM family methyltransferase
LAYQHRWVFLEKEARAAVVSLVFRGRRWLERNLLKVALRPQSRDDLRKIGSDYGGWVVPTSLLSDSSICYCAGVGEDISFDMALIDTFGCEVFAFDPTPVASKHVERNAKHVSRYHFYDVGLWSEDQTLRFFGPTDPKDVSHSAVYLQDMSQSFEARCKRLSSLMNDLGHRSLDLLKLDIEGAEYPVLDTLLEDRIPVNILCVEFHQPPSVFGIWRAVKKLQHAGYRLVSVDAWNYTFLNHKNGHFHNSFSA